MDFSSQSTLSLSVIIPVFNGATYLEEALRSVREQTIRPRQIIVVDDGSTDESARIAESFPGIELLRQKNRGAGAARNTGLDHAQGEWIAFLDADDIWCSNRLELQLQHLANTTFDLSFGHVRIGQMQPDGEMKFAPNSVPAPSASTFLGRRQHFEKIGKFTEDRRLGEFIDWIARAQEAGLRYQILSDVVAVRRLHANNTGVLKKDSRTDYIHLVRAIMERRRENQSLAPAKSP
jgi:glycosyltransferase involved in cell wall biosynthesis